MIRDSQKSPTAVLQIVQPEKKSRSSNAQKRDTWGTPINKNDSFVVVVVKKLRLKKNRKKFLFFFKRRNTEQKANG